MGIRAVELSASTHRVTAMLNLLALAVQIAQDACSDILCLECESMRILQPLCAIFKRRRSLQQALPLRVSIA